MIGNDAIETDFIKLNWSFIKLNWRMKSFGHPTCQLPPGVKTKENTCVHCIWYRHQERELYKVQGNSRERTISLAWDKP